MKNIPNNDRQTTIKCTDSRLYCLRLNTTLSRRFPSATSTNTSEWGELRLAIYLRSQIYRSSESTINQNTRTYIIFDQINLSSMEIVAVNMPVEWKVPGGGKKSKIKPKKSLKIWKKPQSNTRTHSNEAEKPKYRWRVWLLCCVPSAQPKKTVANEESKRAR